MYKRQIYDYVQNTQAGSLPKLNRPIRVEIGQFMAIDPSTRISLEIEKSQKGTKQGSLLNAIDFTKTPQGGRQLNQDLARPLFDIAKINARYDAIAFLIDNERALNQISDKLKETPDLARPLSRIEPVSYTHLDVYKRQHAYYQRQSGTQHQVLKHRDGALG